MSSGYSPLALSIAPRAVDSQELRLGAPWGVDVPSFDGGALYVVTAGECHIRVEDELHRLCEGEVLFLPVSKRHVLADCPSSPTVPMEAFCRDAARAEGAMLFGGRGARTRLLSVGFLLETRRPWLEVLSTRVVGLRGHPELVRWLTATADFLRTDVPLVCKLEVVRAAMSVTYALALGSEPPGLPKIHEGVVRAFAAMRQSPNRGWTVAALAELARMSRSSFAAAYSACFGESPIGHLRRLRLAHAEAIGGEGLQQKALAGAVGYAHGRSLKRALLRQQSRAAPPSRR